MGAECVRACVRARLEASGQVMVVPCDAALTQLDPLEHLAVMTKTGNYSIS